MSPKSKLLSALISLALALGLCPAPAFAAGGEPLAAVGGALRALSDGNIASGIWGTCPWEISADGTLTVHPGTGEDIEGRSPWDAYEDDVERVVFSEEGGDRVVIPPDASRLLAFGHFDYKSQSYVSKVKSIDLSGLDTSNVTDMGGMFACCSSLSFLDLSGLDTSNVTSMWKMFSGCTSLSSLDLSGLDTSSVTEMGSMFSDCSSLSSLDLSDLDTSNVTHMNAMFSVCSSLASLDLSGLDTSSATSMGAMFYGCASLTSLDLSGLDTSSVWGMGGMFEGCSSLSSLDLSGLNASSVMDMIAMFEGCTSLASLNLSGFSPSRVWNMMSVFSGCTSLASLDMSGFDASRASFMSNMFKGCSSLATVYVGSGWTTKQLVNSAEGMFDGCTSLVGGNGTRYDANHIDAEYARADAVGEPGYFTAKGFTPKPSVAGAVVTLSKASSAYTGKVQKGAVKSVVLDRIKLREGRDYTVSAESGANVGSYVVTVTGKGAYRGEASATFQITKAASSVKLAAQTRTYTGKVLAYTGKVTRGGSAGKVTYSYYSDSKCKKPVKAAGVKAAGTYYVKASLAADKNHKAAASAAVKLTVAKAANPMAVAGKTAAVKRSKKAQTVKAASAYKFSKKAAGAVTYARVAKGSSAWLSKVNAKTGAVTVKAGAPRGKTYKVNVKVSAKGDANRKPASKTVAVKVKVR